jgi:tRNA threonylcarbamoyladenosine biosynthesis protein TsaE
LVKIITSNLKETQQIAEKIAKKAKSGDIFALVGEIGTGKTTFAQGFIRGLKIRKNVVSPTFVIINKYDISLKKSIVHIDLYRLKKIDNEILAQILEHLKNPNAICLIEWAEKIKKILPKKTKFINFKYLGENFREISYDFNN